MGWFSSPSPTTPSTPEATTSNIPPLTNLAADLKPATQEKVKPCCVCKDEKSSRDECMLFSRAEDPQEDCKGMVTRYKECMAGYGFKV